MRYVHRSTSESMSLYSWIGILESINNSICFYPDGRDVLPWSLTCHPSAFDFTVVHHENASKTMRACMLMDSDVLLWIYIHRGQRSASESISTHFKWPCPIFILHVFLSLSLTFSSWPKSVYPCQGKHPFSPYLLFHGPQMSQLK